MGSLFHAITLVLGVIGGVQKLTDLSTEKTIIVIRRVFEDKIPLIHTDFHDDHIRDKGCLAAQALMGDLGDEVARMLNSDTSATKETWNIVSKGKKSTRIHGNKPHEEGIGFVVNVEDITVRSPHENGQSYVYDRARMQMLTMNILVPELNSILTDMGEKEITATDLWEYLDIQAMTIMEMLTIEQGKPLHFLSRDSSGEIQKSTILPADI